MSGSAPPTPSLEDHIALSALELYKGRASPNPSWVSQVAHQRLASRLPAFIVSKDADDVRQFMFCFALQSSLEIGKNEMVRKDHQLLEVRLRRRSVEAAFQHEALQRHQRLASEVADGPRSLAQTQSCYRRLRRFFACVLEGIDTCCRASDIPKEAAVMHQGKD